ncbi:hypothetical protein, partial [Klebsiella pneumoniae]|uniref:hypothetical protein n=1 Tax=Klebsiella pneumoniae TaxID=573 RepID=UPI0024DE9A8C
SNMSKLLFFVFIGVCLMAIHLSHAAEQEEEDDQYLNALVESVKPEIQKQFEEADARVEWKKWWNESGKPFVKEIGKAVKPVVVDFVKKQ